MLRTQAQLWTECAPTTEIVRHPLYPRRCALAEGAWSDERRDLADFAVRLARHLPRLAALGALPAHAAGGLGSWFRTFSTLMH